MSEFELNLEKMIAIATDGASNLCGSENLLFTRLKVKYPRLISLKCICHSLNKCVQKACTELPANLEFLLRETHSWFSHSALRKEIYSVLYKSLMSNKAPPKLTGLSNTRWLSFHTATKQMIDQWDVLKTHFAKIVAEAERDSTQKCYLARQLSCMYQDRLNYLYLLFLNSILEEVNKVNLIFQSDKINLIHAYTDLHLLVMMIARRVFKPVFLRADKHLDGIDKQAADLECVKTADDKSKIEFGNSLTTVADVDYGFKFEEYLAKLQEEKVSINATELNNLKLKCRSFLLKLAEEFVQRLPPNFIPY